jgi:hypothetical protein
MRKEVQSANCDPELAGVNLIALTRSAFMNIYQMRHAILAKRTGERITPGQLKAEMLKKFPFVKPQSVNAADCFYSDLKRAGSTCPECGKLGGFAVNTDGIVDMGRSGFRDIPTFYVPTGNTRSTVRPSDEIVAVKKISMSDPLIGFDWRTLNRRYDMACIQFDSGCVHLAGVTPRIATDRGLYSWLIQAAALTGGKRPALDLRWYEALLYWKLYSSTPGSSIRRWLQEFSIDSFGHLLAAMPEVLSRDVDDILALVEAIGRCQVPGMASSNALPVRTTFLHVLYPNVVPIFDRMVLKAVGFWFENANQNVAILRQYLPHAWKLADKYAQQLSAFKESPVRLVDMALWVERQLGLQKSR